MDERKEKKTLYITEILLKDGHLVETYENGHIKVIGVDFWCTTESWIDPRRKQKGRGLKSFRDYLKKIGKPTSSLC